MRYEVYTDGACSGNPGAGGYAFAIISEKESPLVVSGGKDNTTNNRMELMAIVKALYHIMKGKKNYKTEIVIYSDSAYCINSITLGWLDVWMSNNWKTKSGDEVKNRDLWEKYAQVVKACPKLKLKFVKVKGHSGDKYNELVDKHARASIRKT